MKKSTLVFLFAILMSSCVSVNMTGYQVSDDVKKFSSLLVIFSDSDQTFYQWDEENYDYVINTRFNSIDQDRNRKVFANALQKNLNKTKIVTANSVFPIHKPISYAEFNHKLKELEVDGILLVHTKGQWIQETVVDGDTVTKPNAECHIFLLDKSDMQNMWIAKSEAFGSAINNFADLYQKISKEIGSSLSAKGFINKPV